MRMNRALLRHYPAAISAAVAGLCFAAFLGIEWALTQTTIRPHPYLGLSFAVPALYFAAAAFQIRRHPQRKHALLHTGVVLWAAVGLMALISVPCVLIHDAVVTVTDVGSYERVREHSCFSDDLIADFPDRLPGDAEDSKLYYAPFAIGQGGQEIAVGFQTSADTIRTYAEKVSKEASWIGKESDDEATRHGVFSGEFSGLYGSYAPLSQDFTVYVLSGRPYSADWNHGEISLVAISETKNEILFWASKW